MTAKYNTKASKNPIFILILMPAFILGIVLTSAGIHPLVAFIIVCLLIMACISIPLILIKELA